MAMAKNLQDTTKKQVPKSVLLALTILLGLIIFLSHPLGMNNQQSLVTALLVTVVIWWCTGLVKKTWASLVLLGGFLCFSGAPVTTIFSFPLSETFRLIVLTYLFSRGVVHSGLAEKYLGPLLKRCGDTPLHTVMFSGIMFVITMYAIPQPLARLIIIVDIVKGHLDRTDAKDAQKSVIYFGVFVMYIFVNMLTMNADIILNTTAVAVAGIEMADIEWIQYMAVPSLAFIVAVLLLFSFVFRKELGKGKFAFQTAQTDSNATALSPVKEKLVLALVVLTIVLWVSEPWHGVASWIVTLCSIFGMFGLSILKTKDFDAIDITMLVFLTAAMCIGGVMTANGTADYLFSALREIISDGPVAWVIFTIMVSTICIHMMLGSNTTTLSVVIPGITYICSGILPTAVIVFVVYVTSAAQWIFPFHSVGLMMGSSKNLYPSQYIWRMGLPLTALVFVAIYGFYMPWWYLVGLL